MKGIKYFTAEQFMMAEKALLFGDLDIYKRIIASEKPGLAKEFGRKVTNFDQQIWEENRFEIVVQANINKFSQNRDLATFLKNTKDRILVEASPLDEIWGIGLSQNDDNAENPYNWKGLNLLGHALMKTRDTLAND